MLRTPGLHLGAFPWFHSQARPKKTAFIFGDDKTTWGEFDARASKVHDSLVKAGLKKGDKVGLLALNSISTLEIMYGVIRAGGVIVPLSALQTPNLIAALLKDADARFLFIVSPLNSLIPALEGQLEGIPVENRIGAGFGSEGWLEYEDFIASGSEDLIPADVCDEDECVIIYSSGTTGVPKGIVHTHQARNLTGFAAAIEFRVTDASTMLIATPLFTNATWLMLLGAVSAGAEVLLMDLFSPQGFLNLVQKHKITHTFLVPTMFHAVLTAPEFAAYDLSSLQAMVSMGSVLPLAWKKDILEKMGPGLFELYGLTEGIGTTLKPEQVMEKTGSVGSAISGSNLKIIDDDGNELPWGEIGEIVGWGGALMKHYHNRPEATEEVVWRDKAGRTYIRTGDVGRFDEDGFLYIMDRKKDMIVTGGINVFANDIEEVALAHPDVAEVAVIAAPHEKWIETPVAIVVLREGSDADGEGIKAWINERVSAKHQRVSAVEIRSQPLPRNALGKLLKKVLREPLWQGEGK
ncbi:class I adenylate-forming enzyme family protein [Desulfatibacillum aliphaticivorans]|uniref:class I adenylate-forming enzyme family protein n=1 Tax=Desulfatibacillum aliphaticivorans TaxID=218208 RepID=UPI000419DEE6|nr:AMP-binding protein [Desulfatibacillum aliphaticivorans]